MFSIIRGSRPKELIPILDDLVEAFSTPEFASAEGLLYLGYPLLKTAEGITTVHALLATESLGVFAFDVVPPGKNIDASTLKERQDEIYNLLEAKLKSNKEITAGRLLAFNLKIVTFAPSLPSAYKKPKDVSLAKTQEELRNLILNAPKKAISSEIFSRLKAILQGVSKLRAPKERPEVTSSTSKGAIARQLEQQVANLDLFQNKAIVETTNSPQRVTGLAGTGKTVVLAGKAAYLHAVDPTLDIAITFYSRALYQQYRNLLTRLFFNHTQEEPDWSKIKLLHAWGGSVTPGFYTTVATRSGVVPMNFQSAKIKYGTSKAFSGACDELLSQMKTINPVFDVVLIDEAQDMPRSFFEIAYRATRDPHRVVWAYDELQQLTHELTLPGPEILFGSSESGKPNFKFSEKDEDPDDDIILKVCYRNPREIITTAHALGLGVYSAQGPIQMVEDHDLWNRIGYNVVGVIHPGQDVELYRDTEASPGYLEKVLAEQEVVSYKVARSRDEQDDWVSEQIIQAIREEELQASDILVIALGPVFDLESRTARLRRSLHENGVSSHVAGSASADEYFRDGSVAISQIFRAKGNEASLVFIIDADSCVAGSAVIIKRNKLFTAMTRARCWVRVSGVGDQMSALAAEIDAVKENGFRLRFRMPEDMATRRRLHGEMTKKRKRTTETQAKKLLELLRLIDSGDLDPIDLPVELRDKLKKTFSSE